MANTDFIFELSRQTAMEEGLDAPVNWLCVDCGVNTCPGMMTRAEIYKAFVVEGKKSIWQAITWDSEVYEVRDAVWSSAGNPDGCLCIGCLETRLGRKLKPEDFLKGDAFNDPRMPGTKRLLERRG